MDRQTDTQTPKQTNMNDYPIVAEGVYNKRWFRVSQLRKMFAFNQVVKNCKFTLRAENEEKP